MTTTPPLTPVPRPPAAGQPARRRRWWWPLCTVLALALVAGTVGTAVYLRLARPQLEKYAPLEFPAAAPAPITPATATLPPARAAELAAQLQAAASDPALGTLRGQVRVAATGEVLWQQGAQELTLPASITKVLTAAAALLVLDPETRLETTVVELAPAPQRVVAIRAGGDVALTKEQITQLAAEIGSAQQVLLDASAFNADPATPAPEDSWAPGWDRVDIAGGYIAPLEPAMLYGARQGGETGDLPRSATPSLDVAAALAQEIGAASFGYGLAPADAPVLARTTSAPLHSRLRTMLETSDNVLAEAVGREIARAQGLSGTREHAVQAIQATLQEIGVDPASIALQDASGLSTAGRATPAAFTQVMVAATQNPRLRPLLDLLPVAGSTGTLRPRFVDSPATGWVHAKTGTLSETSALVGSATYLAPGSAPASLPAATGLVFAFISSDSEVLPARAALDRLATVLHGSVLHGPVQPGSEPADSPTAAPATPAAS